MVYIISNENFEFTVSYYFTRSPQWLFSKITKIQWLDRRIVTKQPNFDDFEVKYLQIANFSGKKVSFKLKVIFSTKNR